VLKPLCGRPYSPCASSCWHLLCSQCLDLRKSVSKGNRAPTFTRPNHLHCCALFNFRSHGPSGSLSARRSGYLLDDKWSNGCSSESVIDGTKVSSPGEDPICGARASETLPSTERKLSQSNWNESQINVLPLCLAGSCLILKIYAAMR